MANSIVLTLNRNKKATRNAFSWNMKRNGRVVASHAKYERKSNMKDTLKATVLVGWRIDWKKGIGISANNGKVETMKIVDLCNLRKKAA